MIAFLAFARPVWDVLKIAVPIPLFVILAGWLWLHFDKASAVRKAVDRAVADLVAGAQLDALEAQLVEERRLRAFVEGKARALAEANKNFEDRFILAELEKEGLADELEEIKTAPAPDGCVVDRALIERLRQ
jgi:predicted aconitase